MIQSTFNKLTTQIFFFLMLVVFLSSCTREEERRFNINIDAFGYIVSSLFLFAIIALVLIIPIIWGALIFAEKSTNKTGFRVTASISILISTLILLYWMYFLLSQWKYSISYQASKGIFPVVFIYIWAVISVIAIALSAYNIYNKPIEEEKNLADHFLNE